MSITREQLMDLGFKPAKVSKGLGRRKYDSLIYRLNDTDYIFTGYLKWNKKVDFKKMWKTYFDPETKQTVTYPIDRMGVLNYSMVKDFLATAVAQAKLKEEVYGGDN